MKQRGSIGSLYISFLVSTNDDYNLLATCDMPLVDLSVIDLLIREINGSQIIVSEIAGFKVPTIALYHKSCLVKLVKIEEMLKDKDWSLQSLLRTVSTKVIPEKAIKKVDPELKCFTNLNTLEDWQHLTRVCWSRGQEEPKQTHKSGALAPLAISSIILVYLKITSFFTWLLTTSSLNPLTVTTYKYTPLATRLPLSVNKFQLSS